MEIIVDSNLSSENSLIFSQSIIENLKVTAKWAKFLSIIGFIGLGFMLLFSIKLFASNNNVGYMIGTPPNFIKKAMGFVMLILCVIYFFPFFYLYKFSIKIGEGIDSKNQFFAEDAILNLKSHYKFIGIFTLITVSFYAFTFFISVLSMFFK